MWVTPPASSSSASTQRETTGPSSARPVTISGPSWRPAWSTWCPGRLRTGRSSAGWRSWGRSPWWWSASPPARPWARSSCWSCTRTLSSPSWWTTPPTPPRGGPCRGSAPASSTPPGYTSATWAAAVGPWWSRSQLTRSPPDSSFSLLKVLLLNFWPDF